MVKRLDENSAPLDHVGIDLFRAALSWKARLRREMVARGHDWYEDARVTVAENLAPAGLPQSELVARMGTSKQAVQQLLDRLEADGIVRRVPDPADARGKRVEYTAAGLRAVRDANALKRRMEADLRARIGPRGFAHLRTLLADVAAAFDEP